MSKFDYDIFYGGADDLGVSKEKYTKEEAIKIAMVELEQHNTNGLFLAMSDAFARHRAGVNEDDEPCVGWWLVNVVYDGKHYFAVLERDKVEKVEMKI